MMKFSKSIKSIFLMAVFFAVGFSQSSEAQNRFTKKHISEIRKRFAEDPGFKSRLSGGKRKYQKALAEVVGKKLAKRAVINVSPVNKNSSLASARVQSSFTITIPGEAIPDEPNENAPYGEAASTFCISGDAGEKGVWHCLDEEVQVTQFGRVRGRRGSRGN